MGELENSIETNVIGLQIEVKNKIIVCERKLKQYIVYIVYYCKFDFLISLKWKISNLHFTFINIIGRF